MERKSVYTIRSLLEELKKQFPGFRVNQIFETLKSIYPKESFSKKNITYKGKTFTKPLAISRRDKILSLKENSGISNFFKETTKGDFLKVIETDGRKAKCINLSLREEIRDEFYKDEYITISFEDIVNGTIKQVKRKIDKYFKE